MTKEVATRPQHPPQSAEPKRALTIIRLTNYPIIGNDTEPNADEASVANLAAYPAELQNYSSDTFASYQRTNYRDEHLQNDLFIAFRPHTEKIWSRCMCCILPLRYRRRLRNPFLLLSIWGASFQSFGLLDTYSFCSLVTQAK